MKGLLISLQYVVISVIGFYLMACKIPTPAECLQFMRQEKNHNSAGLKLQIDFEGSAHFVVFNYAILKIKQTWIKNYLV